MNGINGTVQANGISGVLGYTREELTMGLNTERMAAIIDLLGGDSTTLPNNLYSTYLNEIIRLLQEGGESQEERFQEILAEYEELKAIISPYITDSAVLGLQVDYENKTFTRLANAFGRNAGADLTASPCSVAAAGAMWPMTAPLTPSMVMPVIKRTAAMARSWSISLPSGIRLSP